MKQLEEKVKDIIVEELGVERDKLTSDASFMEDLGADSLDTVELVMAFEKEFDIDIPDEEAEKLRTVGDALKYLHEKIGKEGRGGSWSPALGWCPRLATPLKIRGPVSWRAGPARRQSPSSMPQAR